MTERIKFNFIISFPFKKMDKSKSDSKSKSKSDTSTSDSETDQLEYYGYETLQLIHQGVISSCYLVHNNEDEKQIAKLISKSSSCYKRELYCLRALSHPNIVKLEDDFSTSSYNVLVLEYCEGGSLNDVDFKTLSETEHIIPWIKQLVSACAYIHSRNIVHRDIKLDNIVLTRTNDLHSPIKLIDFGLGTHVLKLQSEFERGRVCCGTYHYMAPECFQFKDVYDDVSQKRCKTSPKVDVWSLGVVAYILLTGNKPFYHSINREKSVKRSIMMNILTRDYDDQVLEPFLLCSWVKSCLQYVDERPWMRDLELKI
jgi:serine/threonine protein kinase